MCCLENIEISDPILSFVAALIGALLGSLGTYFTLKFNYNQLYAQTVSSNRMDWINVWRENISTFVSCAEILHKHTAPDDKLIEVEKELYKAKAMITSRLNLDEESHITMLALINSFRIQTDDADFANQREAILSLARQILKPEWERVKKEARGKKNVQTK